MLLESIHLQYSSVDLSIHSYQSLFETSKTTDLYDNWYTYYWIFIAHKCKGVTIKSSQIASDLNLESVLIHTLQGFSNVFYWNPSISLGWSLNIYSYQFLYKEVHSAFSDNSACKRYYWRVCISTESTQGCLQFELGRLSARTAGSCDDIAKLRCQILKNMYKHKFIGLHWAISSTLWRFWY